MARASPRPPADSIFQVVIKYISAANILVNRSYYILNNPHLHQVHVFGNRSDSSVDELSGSISNGHEHNDLPSSLISPLDGSYHAVIDISIT